MERIIKVLYTVPGALVGGLDGLCVDEPTEVEGKPEVGKPDEGTYVGTDGKVGGAAV